MPAKKDVHIGQEIKRVLCERGISVSQFAEAICCHRKNVYNIFSRKSIDIDHLIRISEVLDYDFILNCYYDNSLPPAKEFTLVLHNGTLTLKTPVEQKNVTTL